MMERYTTSSLMGPSRQSVLLLMLATYTSLPLALGNFQFLGGSMSFRTSFNNATQLTDVTIDVISSWVLGEGPCGPSCSVSDIGKPVLANTIVNSQNFIKDYGNWSIEYVRLSDGERAINDTSGTVLSNMTRTVIMINVDAEWELERWQFQLTIEPDAEDYQDVRYEGTGWHELSGQSDPGRSLYWHLQSKITPMVRSDTGRPNNSPVTLVRPLYRVKLNTKTSIPIPAVDPDGDFVECRESRFVENGALNNIDFPNGTQIQRDCVITLDTKEENGFHDDYWLPVLFAIADYNVESMQFGQGTYHAYYASLSSTTVQFLVNILSTISGPVFVAPTQPSNHHVILFLGGTWRTELHARAFNGSKVDQFFVFARGEEQVVLTNITDRLGQDGVQFSHLSWTPTFKDLGSHIICISVIDDMGTMSDEDRCFTVEVKDYIDETDITSQVIHFPAGLSTTDFIAGVTHVFPVYVNGNVSVHSLTVASTTIQSHSISQLTNSTSSSPPRYIASLQIEHKNPQKNVTVCLDANLDHGPAVRRCLSTDILPPNPCTSHPCLNSGECQRNPDDSNDFKCLCLPHYDMKDCSHKINACESNPCVHGNCYSVRNDFFCSCPKGYKGRICDNDIDDCYPDKCKPHGICVDGLNNYTCQCYPSYAGYECSTDTCLTAPANSTVCPQVDQECQPDPCNGRGVCKPGPHCVCRRGFTGDHCEREEPPPPDVSLVPLTIDTGSTVRCFYDETGTKPCTIRLFISSPTGSPSVTLNGSSNLMSHSEIGDLKAEKINGVLDLYSTDVSISSNMTSGDNYLCISAFARNNNAADETCVHVSYGPDPLLDKQSVAFLQKNSSQGLLPPTPAAGSQLTCTVNNRCSLFMYSNGSSGHCDRMVSPSDGVTVFEPTLIATSGICVHESTYSFSSEGDRTVCFQTGLSSFQSRCYVVQVVPKDLCLKFRCVHGFCDTSTDQPICLCRAGYTGEHCDTDSSSVSDKPVSTSFIGEVAVPTLVTCDINTMCHISLPMTPGTTKLPNINLGHFDSNLPVSELSTSFVHTDHGYTDIAANVKLQTSSIGEYPLCLQLTGDSEKTEELCLTINSTDIPSVNKTGPYFEFPTTPGNSRLMCEMNKTCHIGISYADGSRFGSSQICPSLLDSSPNPVTVLHIFPTHAQSRGCYNDVVIRPMEKQQTLCLRLDLNSSTTSGEERCYEVYSTEPGKLPDNVLTPCPGLDCLPGDRCRPTSSVGKTQCSFSCHVMPVTSPVLHVCSGDNGCNQTFNVTTQPGAITRHCTDLPVTSPDDLNHLVTTCTSCESDLVLTECSVDACYHSNADLNVSTARICATMTTTGDPTFTCFMLSASRSSNSIGDRSRKDVEAIYVALPLCLLLILILLVIVIFLMIKKQQRDRNAVTSQNDNDIMTYDDPLPVIKENNDGLPSEETAPSIDAPADANIVDRGKDIYENKTKTDIRAPPMRKRFKNPFRF